MHEWKKYTDDKQKYTKKNLTNEKNENEKWKYMNVCTIQNYTSMNEWVYNSKLNYTIAIENEWVYNSKLYE